jgi:hypothetical protein
MPNHMKRCSCKACRRGLHTKRGSDVARRKVRVARRQAKLALKVGKVPDKVFSVPYTD